MRATSSIRLKVQNLIVNFKSIINTRRRSTAAQVEKENNFLEKMKYLFDVIDQNKEVKLCGRAKSFLKDQRENRVQFINTENSDTMDVTDKDSSDDYSSINSEEISHGTINELHESDECSDVPSSDSSYYPSSEEDEDSPPRKRLKKETIEKLQNSGLSYRQMKSAAEAFIEEFNENPSEYCIGISTFHANSTKIRSEIAQKITMDMKSRKSKLVMLFDTKTCGQLNAAHLPKKKAISDCSI